MVISHAKRFGMFLPWKTASQTLALRLRPYDESPYSKFFEFNPHLNRVIHQHLTCADFAALPESRLGYFTGSFVRNPYDRAYSGFGELQRAVRWQPNLKFPSDWVRELVMTQLAETDMQLRRADYQFDAWIALLDEAQIYEAGRNTGFPLHPAHYWTHVAGRQCVDVVGRVERFEPDFASFCAHVGIEAGAENSNVVDLEAGSRTNPFGYRYVDRMNAASLTKINRLFAKDFELFGYRTVTGPATRSTAYRPAAGPIKAL